MLPKPIILDLKVLLEGPFNGTDMNPDLKCILSLNQLYDVSLCNYSGDKTTTLIPYLNIVDWILIELWDPPDILSATQTTAIAQQAAFLKKDGSVVGTDGPAYYSLMNL